MIKPENTLLKADELIAVSQQSQALAMLSEFVLSRRSRTTPISVLEPIVLKAIELAVDLNKVKTIKGVLYQYKNIAQNVAVSTIEIVIKKFLDIARLRLELAQSQADRINLDIYDLEAIETPEHLMMSTVQPQDSREKTDREFVTPWLRFMWEAYKTALDIVKNNVRLEGLYQSVANSAFAFCLKYQRKLEFRRLCDVLRQHLSGAVRIAGQPHAIDLNSPETIQRYLETRFVQLNAAANLEIWQEGFRTVEDIYNLIESCQKMPKLQMMANYYLTLSKILMVGENYLFHSAAYFSYYNVMLQNKSLGKEAYEKMATQILISAISIPITEPNTKDSGENSPAVSRLTALLRSPVTPTRELMIAKALDSSIFNLVNDSVKELYVILESEFHPLSISQKLAPIMEKLLDSDLKSYVRPLYRIIISRIMQQISKSYTAIKSETVYNLLATACPGLSQRDTQAYIMATIKSSGSQIRVSHFTKSFVFDSEEYVNEKMKLMTSPLESLRLHLGSTAQNLSNALMESDIAYRDQEATRLQKLFEIAACNLQKEKENIQFRLALISKKKLAKQQALANQEKKRGIEIERLRVAEELRIESELKKKEFESMMTQRLIIEKQEELKAAEKIADELRSKNIKIDGGKLDMASLRELQYKVLEKERTELAQKCKFLGKRMDHLERALRITEIPVLESLESERKIREREESAKKRIAKIEDAKAAHIEKIRRKVQAARIFSDYNEFKTKKDIARLDIWKVLQADANVLLEAEKKIRTDTHAAKLAAEMEAIHERQVRAAFEAEKERIAEEESKKKIDDLKNAAMLRDAAFEKQKAMEIKAEEKIAAARAGQSSSKWGSSRVPESFVAPQSEVAPAKPIVAPGAWRNTHAAGPAALSRPNLALRDDGASNPAFSSKRENGPPNPAFSSKRADGHSNSAFGSKRDDGHMSSGFASKREDGHSNPAFASKRDEGNSNAAFSSRKDDGGSRRENNPAFSSRKDDGGSRREDNPAFGSRKEVQTPSAFGAKKSFAPSAANSGASSSSRPPVVGSGKYTSRS